MLWINRPYRKLASVFTAITADRRQPLIRTTTATGTTGTAGTRGKMTGVFPTTATTPSRG